MVITQRPILEDQFLFAVRHVEEKIRAWYYVKFEYTSEFGFVSKN